MSGDSYDGPGRPIRNMAHHAIGKAAAPKGLDLELAESPLTDLGNSERLISRSGDDMAHTLERGWGVWNGEFWNFADGAGSAAKLVHRMAEAIATEAVALRYADNKEGANNLLVWARQSANNGRMKAALEIAEPYLRRPLQAFDARADLINLPGGTLELGTADSPIGLVSLRQARREDLITRQVGVSFNPEARALMFEAFLERIMPDYEIRQFLQRFFGYAMTGDSGAQLMLLCYGRGANGKSVLLNILRGVFGDYALTLPFASLTDDHSRGGGDATPDLVRLPGARLVTASEPKVGARLSESTIKIMTGGEPMMVRPLYREPFEFTPTHKIVLSFNNKPKVIATDEGTWRRIAMVPFEVTIPPEERDEHLAMNILRDESAGVLNWVLDGVRMYRESGLAPPARVLEATEEYRSESDPIGPFLDTALDRLVGASVTAAHLRKAYEIWCRLNGTEPVSQTRFGRIMTERGYRKQRSNVYSYLDIDLTAEYRDLVDRADRNYADVEQKEEPPF